jgi:hypothetical protein
MSCMGNPECELRENDLPPRDKAHANLEPQYPLARYAAL